MCLFEGCEIPQNPFQGFKIFESLVDEEYSNAGLMAKTMSMTLAIKSKP